MQLRLLIAPPGEGWMKTDEWDGDDNGCPVCGSDPGQQCSFQRAHPEGDYAVEVASWVHVEREMCQDIHFTE